MAKPNVLIRDAAPNDQGRWQEMWQNYLEFYKQDLPKDVTDETWRRFFDDDCPLFCLVAEDEQNRVLGFAAHVVHPGTWGRGNVCYLEDLYVTPEARCMGVARKMIEHLSAMGRDKGWYRLYWHTDGNNHTARSLYDKVGTLTDRIKYEIDL